MNTLVLIAGPLVTLSVGLAVAFIAWQQWQLARAKLRLDLFDRRYRVFDVARKFLNIIARLARFEDSDLWEYYAGTADAAFLFGPEVAAYLKELASHALDLRTHQRLYEHLPVGPERTHHVEAEAEHLKWLTKQFTDMTNIFLPYLGFSHVR